MRVVWAPLALDRAEEAARYIAADRPTAAAKWIDGLFEAVATLSAFPDKGRMVSEVGRAAAYFAEFGHPVRLMSDTWFGVSDTGCGLDSRTKWFRSRNRGYRDVSAGRDRRARAK